MTVMSSRVSRMSISGSDTGEMPDSCTPSRYSVGRPFLIASMRTFSTPRWLSITFLGTLPLRKPGTFSSLPSSRYVSSSIGAMSSGPASTLSVTSCPSPFVTSVFR